MSSVVPEKESDVPVKQKKKYSACKETPRGELYSALLKYVKKRFKGEPWKFDDGQITRTTFQWQKVIEQDKMLNVDAIIAAKNSKDFWIAARKVDEDRIPKDKNGIAMDELWHIGYSFRSISSSES